MAHKFSTLGIASIFILNTSGVYFIANEFPTLGTDSSAISSQVLAGGVPNLEVLSPSSDLSNTLKNRIVFSTFGEEPRAGKNLTLRNTGSQTLTITALTFGDSQEKFNAVRPADHQRGRDFTSTRICLLPSHLVVLSASQFDFTSAGCRT
jgi:hypothetical protein